MAKPFGEVGMDYGLDARELIGKIKILAGVVVIRSTINNMMRLRIHPQICP